MTTPRLVPQPDVSKLQPLFPAARLLKHAVIEADQLRTQAQQIKAQAESDAAHLKDQAVEDGRREGGRRFAELVNNAAEQSRKHEAEFADQVTAVALRVARAVIDVEFATTPERITELIKTSLVQVRDRFPKRVVAHLHPEDYALVAGSEAEFAGLTPDDASFGFVQDPAVPRHGVQLETELGHYDFAVGEQLDRLREQLLG